jgi:PAS domain S-box-containing protein
MVSSDAARDASAPLVSGGEPVRLRDVVFDAISDGIIVTDRSGRIVDWNAGAERIYGYAKADVIGRTPAFLRAPSPSTQPAELDVEMMTAVERSGRWSGEVDFVRRDGTTGVCETICVPLRDASGQMVGSIEVNRDITERKETEADAIRLEREQVAHSAAEAAQRRLRFLAEAGRVLAGSLDYETTLAATARLIVPTFADWCFIDVIERSGEPHRLGIAHVDPAKEGALHELAHYRPPGTVHPESLVLRALASGTPVFLPEVNDALLDSHVPDPKQRALFRAVGCGSVICVPLTARGRMLGAISLVRVDAARAYTSTDLALAQELAGRAGLAVDNAGLYREAQVEIAERKRAADAQRLLAEAGETLGASLDYETTLERLATLAVPRIADVCMVDMLEDGDRTLRPMAVAHAGLAAIEPHGRRGPYTDDGARAFHVLRTGHSELYRDIADIPRGAPAPSHPSAPGGFAALHALSYMIVPLRTRGRTLGLVSFLTTAASGRRYDDADLALAEELARRAAFAVDNARLYGAALIANQAKADFLAVMSHELRTPLNAIIGYTALLSDAIVGDVTESQRQYLGRVSASAKHLLELIDDILTFSRLEAGREEVFLGWIGADELLREAVTLVEPIALDRHLQLRVDYLERPIALLVDARKVRQVLVNLLSNAVKFTEHGEIRLVLRLTENTARFIVRDTGIGIPVRQQDRIFEPFWQAEQPTKRRTGGTGLGLSVSRRLARLMGGDITVESQEGRGSVFTLTIPVQRRHITETPASRL